MKKFFTVCILIGVVSLFLLSLRGCMQQRDEVKQNPIENKIIEMEKNVLIEVSHFYDLLERADICSTKWINDAKEVSKEMSESCLTYEQLDINNKQRETVESIKEAIRALDNFIALQSNATIEVLEEKSNVMQTLIGDTIHE